MDFFLSEDQVAVHLLLERLTMGQTSSTLQVRLVNWTAHFAPVNCFAKSFKGESGKQHIQAVLTDISEIQKARDELELRVRERTAELENANVELVKSNKQLEELNKELQEAEGLARPRQNAVAAPRVSWPGLWSMRSTRPSRRSRFC